MVFKRTPLTMNLNFEKTPILFFRKPHMRPFVECHLLAFISEQDGGHSGCFRSLRFGRTCCNLRALGCAWAPVKKVLACSFDFWTRHLLCFQSALYGMGPVPIKTKRSYIVHNYFYLKQSRI